MAIRIFLLLVLASLLTAGMFHIGQDERTDYTWVIRETNMANPANSNKTCYPSALTVENDNSLGSCFVPPGRTLIIEEFGIVAAEALDAGTEDCEVVIEYDDVGSEVTGDEIAASAINIGDSNPDGTCGTIDGRGEGCLRTNLDTSVSSGGWWRVTFNDPDGVGELDCSVMIGIDLYVLTRLQ